MSEDARSSNFECDLIGLVEVEGQLCEQPGLHTLFDEPKSYEADGGLDGRTESYEPPGLHKFSDES